MSVDRIAVVSDIHGNILALESVARDIARRGADLVVNLGDHVSGPLWPDRTLSFLRSRDWMHIRGNHDREMALTEPGRLGPSDRHARGLIDDEGLAWLGRLPASTRTDDGILMFHGTPREDDRYLLETVEAGRVRLASEDEIGSRLGGIGAPLLLCGHSHVPRIIAVAGGSLIVNPGSVGCPAYDDSLPEPHVVETGSPHARYAFLRRDLRGWAVDLVAVPYDHREAAEQAGRNGRPEWAEALMTGFMPTTERSRERPNS